MIRVRDLVKTYRVHEKEPGFWGSVRGLLHRKTIEKHAVRGVSLDVGPGEILGLVGPNGAGKTTLVKMLAGIVHPTQGHAEVLGFDPWARRPAFRQQIALVMGQKAQLWWDLPAADSFLLLKEIYRVRDDAFRRTHDELVDLLGVKDQLKIPVRRLSLGERMKLELMAALLHSPRVVYLDEPTIGLDLTAQQAIRDFLLHYRETHRPAMILTSHYMEDIERLCPRIVIIREGKFAFDGPLEQLRQRYGKFKTLVVRLTGLDRPPDVPQAWGEIVSKSAHELRLRVLADRVATAAQAALDALPVHDLAIEEEEIGQVVKRIYAESEG